MSTTVVVARLEECIYSWTLLKYATYAGYIFSLPVGALGDGAHGINGVKGDKLFILGCFGVRNVHN